MVKHFLVLSILLVLPAIAFAQDEKKVDKEWLEKVAQLPAAEQVKAVTAMLQELNFKLPVASSLSKIEDDKVRRVSASSATASNTSRRLAVFKHLRKLVFAGTAVTSDTDKYRVKDLTPFKGMPLVELNMRWSLVKDLSPLKGMQLKSIDCSVCPVYSLAALEGMPLVSVNAAQTEIVSVAALKGRAAGGARYFVMTR